MPNFAHNTCLNKHHTGMFVNLLLLEVQKYKHQHHIFNIVISDMLYKYYVFTFYNMKYLFCIKNVIMLFHIFNVVTSYYKSAMNFKHFS